MPIYNCKCCNFSTKLKGDYNRHIKTKKHIESFKSHHLVTPKSPSSHPKVTPKNDSKNYICKYCKSSFKYKQGMYRHIKYTCKKNDDEDLKELVFLMNENLENIKTQMKKQEKKYEKQQNILYAIGINENEGNSVSFIASEKAEEEFNKYITKQVYIQGNDVVEDDKAYLIDVKKEKALAKDPNHKRKLPLFIAEKDGRNLYVAPIRGKGLWDAIWAYVSIDEDMVIRGIYFDHKAETPGLGANIKQRFFMDDFIGESLLDNEGNFKGVTVSKTNLDPKNEDKYDNEVDAIAGSTITGDGVTAMIRSDLSLYQPYFNSLNNN